MNVKINDNTQPTEINWNKRQLVQCKHTGGVVLTIEDKVGINPSMFAAVHLEAAHFTTYLKQDFKPFNGTITLSND